MRPHLIISPSSPPYSRPSSRSLSAYTDLVTPFSRRLSKHDLALCVLSLPPSLSHHDVGRQAGRQAGRACHKQWHQSDPIEMGKGWRRMQWRRRGGGRVEQEGVGGRKGRFADEAEIVDTFSSFSSPSLSPPLPSAAGCNSIKIGRSAFLLFRARIKGGGRASREGR